LRTQVEQAYVEKENRYGHAVLRTAERNILLRVVDQVWKDHLYSLDHLRQGVHLRSYAQKDPLNEYKREAFGLFEGMLDMIAEKVTEFLFHFEAPPESAQMLLNALMEEGDMMDHISYNRQEETDSLDAQPAPKPRRSLKAAVGEKKGPALRQKVSEQAALAPSAEGSFENLDISRNALCPCQSGKRYKSCHGALGRAS
jgi:preprotein translocase subunit SecA